jgi:lipoprotein
MKKYLSLLLISLLLSACSPFSLVNSESYNNADLSSYKTFRIVTPADGHLPPGMEMVTYYNIAAAIREQMVDRGFTEDPNSPLLINIGVTVHREIQTEPAVPPGYSPYWGPYYNGYYPYFMWPRDYYWSNYYANAQIITGIYKEGVLTMDMVNIDTKVPLFSASVATIMENGQAQFRDLKSIAEAVQTLFSKFPVPLLPQYRK